MELWNKACSIASNWCNAINSLAEYWHIKAFIGIVVSYCYGDIKALIAAVFILTFIDLFVKVNSISYQARKQFGNGRNWFGLGLGLAWQHGMFSAQPMRDKFVPKLGLYLFLLACSGVALNAFKSWGLQDLYIIPQSIVVWIVITELNSIAGHLKDAESPLYGLVSGILQMYYARKGYPPNSGPLDIQEDRPREGKH